MKTLSCLLLAGAASAVCAQIQATSHANAKFSLTLQGSSFLVATATGDAAFVQTAGSGSVAGSESVTFTLATSAADIDSDSLSQAFAGPGAGSSLRDAFAAGTATITNTGLTTLVIGWNWTASLSGSLVFGSAPGTASAYTAADFLIDGLEAGNEAQSLAGTTAGSYLTTKYGSGVFTVNPGDSVEFMARAFSKSTAEAVPEPMTLTLGALGLAAAARIRRRK